MAEVHQTNVPEVSGERSNSNLALGIIIGILLILAIGYFVFANNANDQNDTNTTPGNTSIENNNTELDQTETPKITATQSPSSAPTAANSPSVTQPQPSATPTR
jgi:septal ring-binding cell division protein DamX